MPLSRRHSPEHAPGDNLIYGLGLRYLIPRGVGIASSSLAIFTNTVAPVVSSDFTITQLPPRGRAAYARLAGGVSGTDYQLRWQVTDTQGNVYNRTVMLLCGETS